VKHSVWGYLLKAVKEEWLSWCCCAAMLKNDTLFSAYFSSTFERTGDLYSLPSVLIITWLGMLYCLNKVYIAKTISKKQRHIYIWSQWPSFHCLHMYLQFPLFTHVFTVSIVYTCIYSFHCLHMYLQFPHTTWLWTITQVFYITTIGHWPSNNVLTKLCSFINLNISD